MTLDEDALILEATVEIMQAYRARA